MKYSTTRHDTLLQVVFLFTLLEYVFALSEEMSTLLARASNESLFWGPYRPNLYLGIRPRGPPSLLAGLMWANVDDYAPMQSLRHTCEQGDDMSGYGWEEYDTRTGGRQIIRDQQHGVDITTEFFKMPGSNGGNWVLRVKGQPREGIPDDVHTTVIFYAGMGSEGQLQSAHEVDRDGHDSGFALEGSHPSLGQFQINVTRGPDTNDSPPSSPLGPHLGNTLHTSVRVPPESLWQAKLYFLQHLQQVVQAFAEKAGTEARPPASHVFAVDEEASQEASNLHFVQRTFQGAFEFEVLYNSLTTSAARVEEGVAESLSGDTKRAFRKRFLNVFEFKKPFDVAEYIRFGQEMLSNLLGGIGYFHGDSIVQRSDWGLFDEDEEGFWVNADPARTTQGERQAPTTLFSAIPSRPFFPRGFLWDEGFHLLPIVDWDPRLALDIISGWFSLMDKDGWIAREQILGDEARSRVPPEFQKQYPHHANPPALMLTLDRILDRFEHNDSIGSMDAETVLRASSSFDSNVIAQSPLQEPGLLNEFLDNLYPRLEIYFLWFRKTQLGEIREWDREATSSKEAYRWRGRSPSHCLASGLDDYPRAQPPHPGELHLDLISWMASMTRTMKRVATHLKRDGDIAKYERIEHAILSNIDDLHWSEDKQSYCDASIDEYGLSL